MGGFAAADPSGDAATKPASSVLPNPTAADADFRLTAGDAGAAVTQPARPPSMLAQELYEQAPNDCRACSRDEEVET